MSSTNEIQHKLQKGIRSKLMEKSAVIWLLIMKVLSTFLNFSDQLKQIDNSCLQQCEQNSERKTAMYLIILRSIHLTSKNQ